jgi:hypothetical protein
MLQTTNYFANIHPNDYSPTTHPILHGASLARNTLIHGANWFNVQMLLCTNHHTSNHAQNKALLEGMFAGWVEEWNEWNEAALRDLKNIEANQNNINFELCDTHFVAFGMQAIFPELDIQNLPFTLPQRLDWAKITQAIQKRGAQLFNEDSYKISLPHARATVLSNASKFFPYADHPHNEKLLNVWDSHKNAKIPVRIAHNGTIGCLVDENGKVRKKAEFGYKTKEAFLLEIQNENKL